MDHRPFTVVLADDHAVIRQATRLHMTRIDGLEVVGEADDGPSALALVQELTPDVAVVDLRMPGLSGFQVAEAVRDQRLATRVIVFSAFSDPEHHARAEALGARFVPKTGGVEPLLAALEAVRRA